MPPTHDPAYAAVAEEVADARDALVRVAGAHKGEWMYPADLRALARNGWSSGAMGIAMEALIAEGILTVNDDLCVRLRD